MQEIGAEIAHRLRAGDDALVSLSRLRERVRVRAAWRGFADAAGGKAPTLTLPSPASGRGFLLTRARDLLPLPRLLRLHLAVEDPRHRQRLVGGDLARRHRPQRRV